MTTRAELEKTLRETQREADIRRRIGADLLEDHGVPVKRDPGGEVTDPDLKAKLDELDQQGIPDARELRQDIDSAEQAVANAVREWMRGIFGPRRLP